jgi:hypothetical protein
MMLELDLSETIAEMTSTAERIRLPPAQRQLIGSALRL